MCLPPPPLALSNLTTASSMPLPPFPVHPVHRRPGVLARDDRAPDRVRASGNVRHFPTILKLVRKLRHDTAPFWTISTKKIQLYATPHVPCDMIYFVPVLIGF